MRRLHRPSLGRKTWVWLSLCTRRILVANDPKRESAELWRSSVRHRHRARVLEVLRSFCSGTERCMYCEDSAANEVEHFRPKASYPERAFCWENLLLVCGKCNRFKLTQFPLDARGEPLLIDPTAEDPALHLVPSPRQGWLVARNGSPKGQKTIDVLKLNRWELTRGRQNAWLGLEELLRSYAELQAAGRHERAARCKREICERPFSALLHHMLRVLELPEPERYLLDPHGVGALRSLAPEIRAWVKLSGGDASGAE